MKSFGSLDIVILNAGIGEAGEKKFRARPAYSSQSRSVESSRLTCWLESAGSLLDADDHSWEKTLDIDLRAVLVGTQLAWQCMRRQNTEGVHPSSLIAAAA